MTVKHLSVSRISRIAVLALSLGAVPALAQTDTNTGTGATVTAQEENRDNGFNLGWLGLVGLAGLAGLRRRPPEVVTVTRPTVTDAGSVPQR